MEPRTAGGRLLLRLVGHEPRWYVEWRRCRAPFRFLSGTKARSLGARDGGRVGPAARRGRAVSAGCVGGSGAWRAAGWGRARGGLLPSRAGRGARSRRRPPRPLPRGLVVSRSARSAAGAAAAGARRGVAALPRRAVRGGADARRRQPVEVDGRRCAWRCRTREDARPRGSSRSCCARGPRAGTSSASQASRHGSELALLRDRRRGTLARRALHLLRHGGTRTPGRRRRARVVRPAAAAARRDAARGAPRSACTAATWPPRTSIASPASAPSWPSSTARCSGSATTTSASIRTGIWRHSRASASATTRRSASPTRSASAQASHIRSVPGTSRATVRPTWSRCRSP